MFCFFFFYLNKKWINIIISPLTFKIGALMCGRRFRSLLVHRQFQGIVHSKYVFKVPGFTYDYDNYIYPPFVHAKLIDIMWWVMFFVFDHTVKLNVIVWTTIKSNCHVGCWHIHGIARPTLVYHEITQEKMSCEERMHSLQNFDRRVWSNDSCSDPNDLLRVSHIWIGQVSYIHVNFRTYTRYYLIAAAVKPTVHT